MKRRTPWWIWAIILVLPLIEPAMHWFIDNYPIPGQKHTGFHIGDTPFFLTAMDSLRSGFESPYAVCDSPLGEANGAYFALPHHWIYGVLGLLAPVIGMSDFTMLGWANAAFAALYLLAAYRFLLAIRPQRANLAFLLFSLGGGLAGIIYMIVRKASIDYVASLDFEFWFYRFARYEFIEGPFIAPYLVFARLYYTLPLALGFFALARIVLQRVDWKTLLLLAGCTYLNARVGPFVLFMGWVWVVLQDKETWSQRIRRCALLTIPVSVAFVVVMLQFRVNPMAVENVGQLLRRVAWFSSVGTALILFIPLILGAMRYALRRGNQFDRLLVGGIGGYLLGFTVLYTVHQAYYGNWLGGGDTAAAIAVSDWALIGAVLGMAGVLVLKIKPQKNPLSPTFRWALGCFLIFLTVSISAWGQGAFMQLMPERCLVMLGAPLALLSAEWLARVRYRFPTYGNGYPTVIVFAGVQALVPVAMDFQGLYTIGTPAFQWTHSEYIPKADYECMQSAEGMVLAPAHMPPYMGDVIVHNVPGTRTVFGQPTLEFAGANMAALAEEIRIFFDPATDDAKRKAMAEAWCLDTIYCPSLYPFEAATLEQLSETPWLKLIAEVDGARCYRVVLEVQNGG